MLFGITTSAILAGTLPGDHFRESVQLTASDDFQKPFESQILGVTGATPIETGLDSVPKGWSLPYNIDGNQPNRNPWDVAIHYPSVAGVKSGDTIEISGWVKCSQSVSVAIMFEENSGEYAKLATGSIPVGDTWKHFQFYGSADRDLIAGKGQLSFYWGYQPSKGTFSFAGMKAVDLGNVPLSQFKTNGPTYGDGKPADESWRAAAEARIEKYRKGGLTVEVVNRRGEPVKGATVAITELTHDFHFGTAVPAAMIVSNDDNAKKYRQILADNYNTVVFENDLKWNRLGPPDYSTVDPAVEWLKAHHFAIRGHNLVWGSKRNLPGGLWGKSDSEIRTILKDRITSAMTPMKGIVYIWDVVNEAVSEHDLWDRLGWEEFANMYKYAHAVDPTIELAYNDYNLTTDATAGSGHRAAAIQKVKYLQAHQAPVTNLGIQGHISLPLTQIPQVIKDFNELADLGLKMEVTEFDIGTFDDDIYARYLNDYLTAAFSTPQMQSFLMWGFWQGAHWRAKEGGAIYNTDWTARKPALVWHDLIYKTWWTDSTQTTDANGSVQTRGFGGKYRVTVSKGSSTKAVEVHILEQDDRRIKIQLGS